ncbi:hypothetical protein ACFLTO_01590 [Chloroflexota bacterium]
MPISGTVSGLDPEVQQWLLDTAYSLGTENCKSGATVGEILDGIDEILDRLYKSVTKVRTNEDSK